MKIALHDAERDHMPKKTFPNYALMKISAFHKARADEVEWWNPLEKFDQVYSSKIFDYTPENPYLPKNTVKGGTGYREIPLNQELTPEIDHCFPDYSIYPTCDYAIGYLTRGCPNSCRWCVVPQKEGKTLKGINLFAQAERNESIGITPNKAQKEFANRFIGSRCYKKETWAEYREKRGIV